VSPQPYTPDALPLNDLDHRLLLPAVGQANAALARYDGLLQSIPNPAVMLSPLTTQEAVLSSRIEGTQATVDEVLEHEAGLVKEGEKSQDIQEITNYRQALFSARAYLKDYPIRLGFVLQLHRILMNSVRGQDKTPGEFRRDQNWIGSHGCSIEQAWEKYLDSNDIDFLLQAAVVHAQFELLHPFKDGNGRIGRILIPLFLYQKRAIHEATRSQYTVQESGIHEKTVLGLLRQIRDAGILCELQSGSGRRPATLGFPRLINLAEGREVL
jgi:Fic family protein